MEKRALPAAIDSERVTLRKHSLDQSALMFSYVDRNRQRLRHFLPWVDGTKTAEDERAYIQMTLDKWNAHELFDYGIFRKSDGLYMGNVGVHTIA